MTETHKNTPPLGQTPISGIPAPAQEPQATSQETPGTPVQSAAAQTPLPNSAAPVLDTQMMMSRLKGDSFPAFDNAGSGFLDPDIRDFFDELFLQTGHSRSSVIRDANISRTYGYQIMDGTRVGKRDYYLSIAFAMGLDLTTTQRMLAVTSNGPLHALIKRDAAIIFALNHHYDSIRLYEFLLELGLPPLDTGIEGA